MSSSSTNVQPSEQPSEKVAELIAHINQECSKQVETVNIDVDVLNANRVKAVDVKAKHEKIKTAVETNETYKHYQHTLTTNPSMEVMQRVFMNAAELVSKLKTAQSMILACDKKIHEIDQQLKAAKTSNAIVKYSELHVSRKQSFLAVTLIDQHYAKINTTLKALMPNASFVLGNEKAMMEALFAVSIPSPVITYFRNNMSKLSSADCKKHADLILDHVKAYDRQKMARTCVSYPSYMSTLTKDLQTYLNQRASHATLTHPHHNKQVKLSFERRFLNPVDKSFTDAWYNSLYKKLTADIKSDNLPPLKNLSKKQCTKWLADNNAHGAYDHRIREILCLISADECSNVEMMHGFDVETHMKATKKATKKSAKRRKKMSIQTKLEDLRREEIIAQNDVDTIRVETGWVGGKAVGSTEMSAARFKLHQVRSKLKKLARKLTIGAVKEDDDYLSSDLSSSSDDSSGEDNE